jgi:hypothetical protein
MMKNEKTNPIPNPNVQDVRGAYGELAEEYAKVRADAAEAAGNPATPDWEHVEQELRPDQPQAD